MATPLTKQQLLAMPVQDIPMLTGDVFFCNGSYLSSKLIQTFTDSIWSHCGLVWSPADVDKTLFLEADYTTGVSLTDSRTYTKKTDGKLYDGPVVLARPAGLSHQQALKAIEFGLCKLGESYSVWDLIQIGLDLCRNRFTTGKPQSWICSNLVNAALASVGYGTLDIYATPADLWRNPTMIMLGRIA